MYQTPFFGFLGVCMSGPEEDLAWGGRFLLWWERFIKFFNIKIFQIILQNALTTTENDHPEPNPLQGHSYIPQGSQKKVSAKSVKKSGRPSAQQNNPIQLL